MENVYDLLSKDMVVFMDHILEELAKFDHVHSYTNARLLEASWSQLDSLLQV